MVETETVLGDFLCGLPLFPKCYLFSDKTGEVVIKAGDKINHRKHHIGQCWAVVDTMEMLSGWGPFTK